MRHRITSAGIAGLAVTVALTLSGCGGSGDGDARKQASAGASGEPAAASGAPATAPTAAATTAATDAGASSGAGGGPATATGTGTATVSSSLSSSASPSGPAAPTAGGSGDGTADATQDPRDAQGVWLAAQGADKVQLVLGKGEAGLTSTSLCGGTYTDRGGIGLKLTCMDGNRDRVAGRGELAPDGRTLTVRWSTGMTDTFARTGLPSS